MAREARTRQPDRQCHCEKEEAFKNLMTDYDSSKESCRKTSSQKFAGSNPFESQMGSGKFCVDPKEIDVLKTVGDCTNS